MKAWRKNGGRPAVMFKVHPFPSPLLYALLERGGHNAPAPTNTVALQPNGLPR